MFPKNINVSATLQLALSQFPCAVKIVAVPGLNKNIHEIEIIAEAGRMVFRLENEPSPKNPRTSYLAVLSAKALLEEIFSNVRVGN